MDKDLEKNDVIVVRAPIVGPQLPRPPFETPLVKVETNVAGSLKELANTYAQKSASVDKGYFFSHFVWLLESMDIITKSMIG